VKRVIIESPLAGDMEANIEYAKLCLKDSIDRGEAPFASHLIYTEVLDDSLPEERAKGMAMGFAWMQSADLVAVYIDRGISKGMKQGITLAKSIGIPFEMRELNEEPK
jgi:hypothetical protein